MSLRESWANGVESKMHKLYDKHMKKGWKRAEKVYFVPGGDAAVQCHQYALQAMGIDGMANRIWLQRHPEAVARWFEEWCEAKAAEMQNGRSR